MTDTKLNPCPFCGDKDPRLVDASYGPKKKVWIVMCYGCQADGPPGFEDLREETSTEAIEGWNRAGKKIAQKDAEIEYLKKRVAELEDKEANHGDT